MKIEITKEQLRSIRWLASSIEATMGCGDDDREWVKNIRLVNRFLNKNTTNTAKKKP